MPTVLNTIQVSVPNDMDPDDQRALLNRIKEIVFIEYGHNALTLMSWGIPLPYGWVEDDVERFIPPSEILNISKDMFDEGEVQSS